MIERKYLAHFIDANHVHLLDGNKLPSSYATSTRYIRLGEHLEQFSEEMNPQIDVQRNVFGDPVVLHAGYQVESSVDVFYASRTWDDPSKLLYEWVLEITNGRLTGDNCKTTRIEAMIDMNNQNGFATWAYKEDCFVVPQSFGGDTSGVQLPFQIINAGNRVKVQFDLRTKRIVGLGL